MVGAAGIAGELVLVAGPCLVGHRLFDPGPDHDGELGGPGVQTADPDWHQITVVPDTPQLTAVAPASARLGAQLSATATLTGTHPAGSMTFELFGPADPTCAAAPIHTSHIGVAGNGTYAPTGAVATQRGTYRWKASYAGDADNTPASLECGTASTTVADAAPTPSEPPPASPPAPPAPAPPAPPDRATFTTSPKRLRVSSSGRFTYTFHATRGRSGSAALESVRSVKVGSKRRKLRLASKPFATPTSGAVQLTYSLSRANLKALKRSPALTFDVRVTLGSTTFATKLKLTPPREHH